VMHLVQASHWDDAQQPWWTNLGELSAMVGSLMRSETIEEFICSNLMSNSNFTIILSLDTSSH
jgi:hypothetical protein